MERKRTSAARATCVAALASMALFLAASVDAQETDRTRRPRSVRQFIEELEAALSGDRHL